MIDAHQHFWRYDAVRDSWITEDMGVIRRDFLPADLKPLLERHGIEGCVAVQADQSETETNFLLALADQVEFIKGVVGWVDLRSPDLEERLQHFSQYKKLKGFRHVIQGEPAGFMTQSSFIQGVKMLARYGFTYDLLVYHYQLEEALKFVYELGDVPIVVDHLAKPSIRSGEKTQWELNMAALSTFENVYCKISGMVTEANWKTWKPSDFHPYMDELFETFGADRLMYGSDWPVCLVAASYDQQVDIVTSYLEEFSSREKKQVMHENAVKFYNL
jgi:L-fuconolactonase